MGYAELNNKISIILRLPINTEERAVYFMVEIRKTLEHEKYGYDSNSKRGLTNDEKLLNDFCNWAAHVAIDSSSRLIPIIKSKNIWENLKKELRRVLKIFLELRVLNTELVTNDDNWIDFTNQLYKIYNEVPIRNNKKVKYCHVHLRVAPLNISIESCSPHISIREN